MRARRCDAAPHSGRMKRLLLLLLLFFSSAVQAATLLVVNKADATLSFVDAAAMKVVATIPTGEGPHEVVATADGRFAIVTNYGTGPNPGSSLMLVDVAARKEIERIALPGLIRPHGLFAVGQHIYFTAEGSKVAARYDVAARRLDWIGGTGQEISHMLVVTPDGKKVYTANIVSGTVTALSLAQWPQRLGTKFIEAGKGPEGIGISPDGKEVWVAQRGDGTIAVIDTATDTVTKKFAAGKLPFRVAFTPDGKHVVITDAVAKEVLICDAATKEIVRRLTTEEDPAGLAMQPDGKRVWIAYTGAGKVGFIDLETMTVGGTVATGNQPDGVAVGG
jgi:YVTN family beta-propeller protein